MERFAAYINKLVDWWRVRDRLVVSTSSESPGVLLKELGDAKVTVIK